MNFNYTLTTLMGDSFPANGCLSQTIEENFFSFCNSNKDLAVSLFESKTDFENYLNSKKFDRGRTSFSLENAKSGILPIEFGIPLEKQEKIAESIKILVKEKVVPAINVNIAMYNG